MATRPLKSRKPPQPKPQLAVPVLPKFSPDLSFPVSYREQQKYLELADRFLALDGQKTDKVIPIDLRRRSVRRKKAA
jgi:hypothetical protein